MNRSNIIGAVVGAGAVLSIGAIAGYQTFKEPAYAEVVHVSPVHKNVMTSENVCNEVSVVHKAPVQDENRIAGTVMGGVLGGLLGNQVGKGVGNNLATVAGAAGGAYAGNRVQKGMQDKDTSTSTEQRCHIVKKSHDTIVGYNVRYRLDGREDTVRMEQPPSDNRIPVEHGKLVLNTATADGQGR
ncbi:MAG: glycine zipper 2TM domain-containing protein [Sterolibacterium sp.]